MKYEAFENKFGLKWAEKFKPFIEGKDMDNIFAFLKERSSKGYSIIPHHTNTFKVFEKTPYDKLRVIFFMDSPYGMSRLDRTKEEVPVANGIALDCSNTMKVETALENFYEMVERDNYGGMKLDYLQSPSLQFLLNQGVMMLNSDLTTEENYPDIHKGVWRKFIKYFIEEILNPYFKGLILVFTEESSKFEKYVDTNQHYTLQYKDGVFQTIDTLLKANNGTTIDWLNITDGLPF